jgi:hypothetical protein
MTTNQRFYAHAQFLRTQALPEVNGHATLHGDANLQVEAVQDVDTQPVVEETKQESGDLGTEAVEFGEEPQVLSRGIERMVTCYCCGRGFSTYSLPKHLANCPTQRQANYRDLPAELRPAMPKPPALSLPTNDSKQAEIEKYNAEAMTIYRDAMASCPQCGRKFEPDRLPPHMRGCKGASAKKSSTANTSSTGGVNMAAQKTQALKQTSSPYKYSSMRMTFRPSY